MITPAAQESLAQRSRKDALSSPSYGTISPRVAALLGLAGCFVVVSGRRGTTHAPALQLRYAAAMNLRALDLVAAHCDIEERLRAIPPSARIRGLAFGPIKGALGRAGKIQAYEELFGKDPHGSMSLYPLGDYVLRM